MTRFDLSQRLRDWGSDKTPVSSYKTYSHAYGLDMIGHSLEWERPPFLVLFPRFPHHNRLMVRLREIPSAHPLGCFDESAIQRAYERGVDVEIHNKPGDRELYAEREIAKRTFVDKRYKIVHVQEFEEFHFEDTI